MAAKFKPCPFCGEAPTVSTRKDEALSSHNIVDWHEVRCGNCDIWMDECEDLRGLRARWNSRRRARKVAA